MLGILYSGNVWRWESLANLANEHNFAKLKPIQMSHAHYIAIDLYTNLPNFFRQNLYQINFAKHYCCQTFLLYGSMLLSIEWPTLWLHRESAQLFYFTR